MVKADPKRNYYADLDVRTNATTDEIKKSFRALARRYHPDRNPGNEVEFVPKFQAIQAAHEILADPEQRAKYDAERRKLGYWATTRPPLNTRGTPFSNANYPSARGSRWAPPTAVPPPRHAPTAQQPKPTYPTYPRPPYAGEQPQYSSPNAKSTGTSGANRYAFFPHPPPQWTTKDPAQDRANVFTAWQHLNPQHRGQGAQPAPGTPWSDDEKRARGAARESAYGRTTDPEPGLGRSNTARTPRKSGFDPKAPNAHGDFWEPPASRSSSYYRATPPAAPEPPKVPPRPAPPAQSAQPAQPQQESTPKQKWHGLFPDGSNRERVSTPYASHGGEKTYLSSDFVSKSTGGKEPRGNHPVIRPQTGIPRARSVSPKGKSTPERGPFGKKARAKVRPASTSRKNAKSNTSFDIYSSGSDADSSASSDDDKSTWANVSQRPKATPSRRWARGDSPSKAEEEKEQRARSENSDTPAVQSATEGTTPGKNGTKPMYGDNHFPFECPALPRERLSSKASGDNLSGDTTPKATPDFLSCQSSLATPAQDRVRGVSKASTFSSPSSSTQQSTAPVPLSFGKSAFVEEQKNNQGAHQWSSIWPFGKNQRRGTISSIPSWAIPSSVSPPKTKIGDGEYAASVDESVPLVENPLHRDGVRLPSSNPNFPRHFDIPAVDSISNIGNKANRSLQSSFNIPGHAEVPQHRQTASDTETVNTSFSAAEWSGKFEGNQTFTPAPANSRRGSRARQSPTRATAPQPAPPIPETNPLINDNINIPPPPTTAPPNPVFGQSQATKAPFLTTIPMPPLERKDSPVKFAAEEWQQTFKEPTFLYPNNSSKQPGRSTSTTGKRTTAPRGRSMSKSDERPGVPAATQGPSVEEESPSAKSDGDAMDIDPPEEITPNRRGPRLVQVPPSRREWRDSADSTLGSVPVSSFTNLPSAVPNAVPPPPLPVGSRSPGKQKIRQKQRPARPVTPPTLNLGDLKQSISTPTAGGIGDLKNMSTTLPFESRASTQGVNSPSSTMALTLPKAPIAPLAPTGRRLNPAQWKAYLAQISAYMGEWHVFEGKILQRFVARHTESAKFGVGMPSTSATKLLEAQGEPGEGGILAYVDALGKDRRVREAWGLACEKHERCVREFVNVKERTKVEGFALA